MGASIVRQIALPSVSETPEDVTTCRSNADVRPSDAAVEAIGALVDAV
jgi:hypothetical protein